MNASVPSQETTAPTSPLVVLRLHEQQYGLPAHVVREVVCIPELASIPDLPCWIIGCMNHRGAIIPVMDLSRRLGRRSRPFAITDHILVFECQEGALGLIINEVVGIFDPPAQPRTSLQAHVDTQHDGQKAIHHVTQISDEFVLVLDPEVLIKESSFDVTAPHEHAGSRDIFPSATQPERALLKERARSIKTAPVIEETDHHIPLAVAVLNQAHFGIDLHAVRECAEMTTVVPIPCCPDFVVGAMNLHGDLVTVIDLYTVLNLSSTSARPVPSKILVVEEDQFLFGFLVDDVVDCIMLNPDTLTPISPTKAGNSQGFQTALTKYRETILILLDIPKLIRSGVLVVEESV